MQQATRNVINSILENDRNVTKEELAAIRKVLDGGVPRIQLMTPKEAAETLGVCRRTLYQYADSGKLTRIYHSKRKIRFDRAEVERLAFVGTK